ncbi:hypothetical protein C8E02_0545 [Vogesella indigofera]|uniref:Uncharacterized protein n=1 Tax=Vogesella indigofera TaxID=45465 RepID=A0A495BJN6_VOGIN|nr:hypothetical protein [Vogesella indigofera]RKQ60792.1 hypothetical protein C8E02_0545 [Vogesella indigofera]
MASELDIARAATGLAMGLRDFCSWSDARLPYDGQDLPVTLLSLWGRGAWELQAELAQYAPLVVQLEAELWAVLQEGFPGWWHYEVVEALGWAIADWIVQHAGAAPSREWVSATLLQLAGQFFTRAPQADWPALRAVLLRHTTDPSTVLLPA